jgi:hypothetical protein
MFLKNKWPIYILPISVAATNGHHMAHHMADKKIEKKNIIGTLPLLHWNSTELYPHLPGHSSHAWETLKHIPDPNSKSSVLLFGAQVFSSFSLSYMSSAPLPTPSHISVASTHPNMPEMLYIPPRMEDTLTSEGGSIPSIEELQALLGLGESESC